MVYKPSSNDVITVTGKLCVHFNTDDKLEYLAGRLTSSFDADAGVEKKTQRKAVKMNEALMRVPNA